MIFDSNVKNAYSFPESIFDKHSITFFFIRFLKIFFDKITTISK